MKSKQIAYLALFITLGLMLPFLTASQPRLGQILLLIHIPALLGGLIMGPKNGLLIGITLPLLRSLFFTMPPLYPTAIAMAVEMGTYGYVIGLIYEWFKSHRFNIHIALIVAMLIGRVAWGFSTLILLGVNQFNFQMFLSAAFIHAWPGLVLQFVLIPLIMNTTEPLWRKLALR